MTQASTRKFAGSTTPCQSNAAAMRFDAFAAGGEESGDAGDENQAAQRIGVAPSDARRRQTRLERTCGFERALDVGVPERERIGVLRRDRQFVGNRSRRAVIEPAHAIEPAQAVGRAGHAQEDERDGGGDGEARERQQPCGASERRQPQPKPRARTKPEKARSRSPASPAAGHRRSQKIVQRAR